MSNAVSKYRLVEECLKIINSGDIQTASNVSWGEVEVAVGQVANSLLRTEHMTVNERMGETIPNGAVLGWYEGIDVTSYGNGKSRCSLPIKPMKLRRNMGVFGIYPKYMVNGFYDYDQEFIPLQMGQGALIQSQPMINDLLGQVGYEVFGLDVVFNRNLKLLYPDIKLGMRLAILDLSQYDDYAPLPILPEQEFQIKQQVIALFSSEGATDKIVDVSNKQQQVTPVTQQKQA